MTNFTNDPRLIPFPRPLVFGVLSNFENLARIREAIAADGDWTDVSIDRNSFSFKEKTFGTVRLFIKEREEPSKLLITVKGLPFTINAHIELLENSETETEVRVTLSANLNPLMKSLFSSYLPEGAERLADTLATLPYDEYSV
jgi:carbon monoxide dehydrogenase subunit G